MDILISIAATVMMISVAQAETVQGHIYTPSPPKLVGCDVGIIPDAVKASTEAALTEALKICSEPKILAIRVQTLGPVACYSWTPGYLPIVEIDFNCTR
jgi:hypothetical protein